MFQTRSSSGSFFTMGPKKFRKPIYCGNHRSCNDSELFLLSIFLFVTEEIPCIIECERTMVHYCTHLCRQWTILHSITAGIRSRELCQAPMLLVFLTPRQALSSHPRQILNVKSAGSNMVLEVYCQGK